MQKKDINEFFKYLYLFILKKSRTFAVVIELERHIEILLLSNDCVIVPDFGGFMAHHVDAHYDEDEGLFLPPQRTLGFNPQLKINDSLLAQSYVEAYDISYPEAVLRIEDEVNELKMHLQTKGFYELSSIGTLEFNENGNYVFTPCEAGILTPDLYGLCSFEMTPLKITAAPVPETVEEEEEEKEATQIFNINPLERDVETTEAEAEVEAEDEEEEDVVRIKFSWIRNAVAVAAILLAVFFAAMPTGKTEMMTRTISNINSNLFFGMMSKDTNTSKIEISKADIQKPTNKADTISKLEKIKTEQTVKAEPVKKGYCIVLASQVSKRNAEMFIERLKAKGLDSAEIYVKQKAQSIRRVVCGNFQTQEEAYNELRKIHKDEELKDAWVYKYN
jgi:cell division septation protein DedD